MSQPHPPYFFPEALLAGAKTRERERLLGITPQDSAFFTSLFFTTASERRQQRPPMLAKKIWLHRSTPDAVELAGSFTMSSTGAYKSAFLYTPYGGLEKFENHVQLLASLTERLKDPEKAGELLHFVSLHQQNTLKLDSSLKLSDEEIMLDVFVDQEKDLARHQNKNLSAILVELKQLPTLDSMLTMLLKSTFHDVFPAIDPGVGYINFFAQSLTHDISPLWVESLKLPDMLLRLYQEQSWPIGQMFEVLHPLQHATAGRPKPAALDRSRWKKGLDQAQGQLMLYLCAALETYWNTDIWPDQSRRVFFTRVMANKARIDLLLKRQQSLTTPLQSEQLCALYSQSGRHPGSQADGMRFEVVRIWEHPGAYVEPCGTFLIGNSHTWLYSQPKGLQGAQDYEGLVDTLKRMINAPNYENDLHNLVSLEERTRLIGFTVPQITGVEITGNPFEHLLNQIISKQQENLVYALGLIRRTRGGYNPSALIDHALDIRFMVDSRLLELDAGGRWTTHSVLSDPERPISVVAERAGLMHKQLLSLEDSLVLQADNQPRLSRIVKQLLVTELERRQLFNLAPGDIYINRYAQIAGERETALPTESHSLIDYCVGRMTQGLGQIMPSLHHGLYGPRKADASEKLTNLNVQQANSILETALVYLRHHNIANLPENYLKTQKANLAHTFSVAMQSEARLRRTNKTLTTRDEAIVQAVFAHTQLGRQQRQALDGFVPDAYSVCLQQPGLAMLLPLANCLLMTERGGLDPEHSGKVLLWTPSRGLEHFTSTAHVGAQLRARLLHPIARLGLLENLDPLRRKPHQGYELGAFRLINEAVAPLIVQSWIADHLARRAYYLALKLSPATLLKRLEVLNKSLPAINLPHATRIAHTLKAQQSLPAWLGMATIEKLQHHAEILEQYRRNVVQKKDYLDNFFSLQQYVRDKLKQLLTGHGVNPEQVYITPKNVLAGERQKLTDYALNHSSQQTAAFTVESRSTDLTETVVRQILGQLKIVTDAQAYLHEHLSPGKPGALDREQRFIRQLPWQLLQHAHTLNLQGVLSKTGFDLIQQILDMPDPVARARVSGATALIRPLELVATVGARAVKALGIYLINTATKAPLVMYAPYHPRFGFKEFEDEADFLTQLNQPGEFQDWVIEHLMDPASATYRNLLASTVGAVSEISLAANPIATHAIKQLYQDNIQVISAMLDSQKAPNGQSCWETVKELLTEGLQRTVQFLPGKLVLPLVVWQSYTLFKSSAEALQNHHWSEALHSFIQGVAEMATVRSLMSEWIDPRLASEHTVDADQPPSWQNLSVTGCERTLLQPAEATQVSLSGHSTDENGVYPISGTQYVPFNGKVYPIEELGTYRRITTEKIKGPFVKRNEEQSWVLDHRPQQLRFGPSLSRVLDRREVRTELRQLINIEAKGMGEIRRIFPEKAQAIVEGLDLATFYLHNCQQNLKLLEPVYPPVTRVHRFIADFFGIETDPETHSAKLGPDLVQTLRNTVTALLEEILEPSIYSLNSTRFVVGSHRIHPKDHCAFTIDNDPDRRIYLTAGFFDQPLGEYEGRLITHFDMPTHARAATIIHELSHIIKNTADAAYLLSGLPFNDLIETTTPAGRELKNRIQSFQSTAYSVRTPIGRLFKTNNLTGEFLEDFGVNPDTDYIKQQILNTTGGIDLSNARGLFKTNLSRRFATQMDNADSLTLLITSLGRQLDPVPDVGIGTPSSSAPDA